MVELRRRGALPVIVCSEEFLALAQTQARIFGAPDLPIVAITHPLGGISMPEVKARANQALPQLIKFLREFQR